MLSKISLIGFTIAASASLACAATPIEIGRLNTGSRVAFVTAPSGGWGIKITGPVTLTQMKPAGVEIYRNAQDIRHLAASYKTVHQTADGVEAIADIIDDHNVLFRVDDHWNIHGAVLSLKRKVTVVKSAPGGFYSAIMFNTSSAVGWNDVKFLAPGVIYGDPLHDGDRSPGGTLNDAAHRLMLREDILPAPLFALSFNSGASVSLLDPAPRGNTTLADTKLEKPMLTDARFQFGAMGAMGSKDGSVAFGFRFPGTVQMYTPDAQASQKPAWVRRYHPIEPGIEHQYSVDFRFGKNESFGDVTRESWRWAWQTLQPAVMPLDVDLVRRTLTDHLEAQAATIDGRTGMPFVLSTMTDTLQWNWTMIAMGFVGKDLECADELLRESDSDISPRGQKMRETGLAMIDTMIKALPDVPLQATGFDLATGKPWTGRMAIWLAPYLRNASEGMHTVLVAYRRESAHGHPHPEWLNWVKSYADWLLQQQRADGSFPRRWKTGSNVAAEPSGTASYAPIPLLVLLSEQTADKKYLKAAERAGSYVWSHWGERGLFVGGASDNPNITDKEAGMLSLTAYLDLYDTTSNKRWLQYAQAAGNYAESWIWIWNLPMPEDATDADLDWKKNVPTIGLQGITARAAGGADEYLDWAVADYARLYKDTGDRHYRDVAAILLNNTKSMVALPGRLYDMKGPGWQQEHWSMGPGTFGRGSASHRLWLPWVSANHLHGIMELEAIDPVLFKELSSNVKSQTD
ncbi:MAG: hypothetical protein ABUL52_01360 [Solimonas sp.]